MRNTVFFSWQSDLPNNKNRSFIETCLEKAIESLKDDVDYKLELNLDRDTKLELGTPDITESIFKKIDKCSFFIADISIINGKSRKYRKTPNPNVLVELGYAAKKLGWSRVICIFNLEFGKISDLPFDLRNRRILTYEINDENKTTLKKSITKIFRNALVENYKKDAFSNQLIDYYNNDIYTLLLNILLNISKFVNGYSSKTSSIECVKNILNLSEEEIDSKLNKEIFIGFQLFKSYDEIEQKLSKQADKIVNLKNFDDEYYVPIVKIITILRMYNKELNRHGDLSKLNDLKRINSLYKVIPSERGKTLVNRYILLRTVTETEGVVVDFGDIIRKDHIDNCINEFKLTKESKRFYKGFILDLLKEINQWIYYNNGEFNLDATRVELTNSQFEITY